MPIVRLLVISLLAGLSFGWLKTVLAQPSCPDIVQKALQATDQVCLNTGRNQACYGNIVLEAEPQAGVNEFSFATSGDIAAVEDIQTLRLSSMNAETGEWGVALMLLQANLPDTLPGQNVTFLLFGDVEITNAVETSPPVLPTLDITSAGDINVRGGPSTNDRVVGNLTAGQTVTANGRLQDGSWLRIEMPTGDTGWVFSQLVTTEGDMTSLAVAAPEETTLDTPRLTPMQAFYFRSGKADAPCVGAPDSGILIQTPKGAGEVEITVNEVNIRLASTLYLQAQAGEALTVNVIEGQAAIETQGVTQVVPAGTRARVPLDNDLRASGPPKPPEPYDEANLVALPINNLEQAVSIAPNPPAVKVDITDEGSVEASSTYPGFSTALGVDSDRSTSWFSAGPGPNGSPSVYRWTGTREEFIATVTVLSNAQHSNPSFRTGFGFGSVTIQILNAADQVVFEETVELEGTPDPDVVVRPGVVGRSVMLSLTGHEDPSCGGFSELQIEAVRYS